LANEYCYGQFYYYYRTNARNVSMKKTTSQYSVIDDRKTNTNLTKYVEKHLEIVVSSQDIFKNTFYSRVLTKHVDLG